MEFDFVYITGIEACKFRVAFELFYLVLVKVRENINRLNHKNKQTYL